MRTIQVDAVWCRRFLIRERRTKITAEESLEPTDRQIREKRALENVMYGEKRKASGKSGKLKCEMWREDDKIAMSYLKGRQVLCALKNSKRKEVVRVLFPELLRVERVTEDEIAETIEGLKSEIRWNPEAVNTLHTVEPKQSRPFVRDRRRLVHFFPR